MVPINSFSVPRDLATHRNRCYVFDLNKTFSLDSTYVGNISRFIDHSDPEQSGGVNSQAQGTSLPNVFHST